MNRRVAAVVVYVCDDDVYASRFLRSPPPLPLMYSLCYENPPLFLLYK